MSKILFVGTERALTHMTGRLLKRNGFDVQCAVGAEEALQVIRANEPAVVIADLEMNGTERTCFCREIKQSAKAPKLLLISGGEEDEIPTLNAGADDWIKKPYHMDVLYTRIKVLLRQE